MLCAGRFCLLFAVLLSLGVGACDPLDPEPEPPVDEPPPLPDRMVPADGDDERRDIPPRAIKPWREEVAELEAAFALNPDDPRFPPFDPSALRPGDPPIAANEAAPVDAIITQWNCDWRNPDVWDDMWMSIIGESVRAGAEAYVYLEPQSFGGSSEAIANCGAMLERAYQIDLDRVHFILGVPSDAFWTRDYGPLFVRDRDDATQSVRDPRYYPHRPNDDEMPSDFAARLNLELRPFPVAFEGGNFLPNGGGLCIVGSVAARRNPQLTESDLTELFRSELGCDQLVMVRSLEDFATGHVDMWLAWANRTTLIVGEYTEAQDPTNRRIIETNLEEQLRGLVDPASGEPIQIVRIPMPSNCPADFSGTAPDRCPSTSGDRRVWRSYLNVLEVNNTVLVPVFEQHDALEADALAVWSSLGFETAPVPSDHIIPYAGAIHCITKSIDSPPEPTTPVTPRPRRR